MADLPSFAEFKKNKAIYQRFGKRHGPKIALFHELVEQQSKRRSWPVKRVLNWIARRTGISIACLHNWYDGITRHPSTRTYDYMLREAFGVDPDKAMREWLEQPEPAAATVIPLSRAK